MRFKFLVEDIIQLFKFIHKMPYLYKLEIRQSSVHGKGVFALEDIPKGATYWVFQDQKNSFPIKNHTSQPNLVHTKEDLFAMENEQQVKSILYGGLYYADADVYIEFRDGSEFMNHSQVENSQVVYDRSKDYRKMRSYTTKEIKAGEEILENYGNYLSTSANWINSLMGKYSPERQKLQVSLRNVQHQQILTL